MFLWSRRESHKGEMVCRDIRWTSIPSIKNNFQLFTMNAYAKQKTFHRNEGDFQKYLKNKSMRTSEDRSGPLVTCTGNPCQSTGTSSPVSIVDLRTAISAHHLFLVLSYSPDGAPDSISSSGESPRDQRDIKQTATWLRPFSPRCLSLEQISTIS